MIEHRCSKSVATDCYSRRLIDYFRKKMNENVCNRIYNIYFCFPNQNTIYMNDDRVCRECGDVLQGRADKKFCDDQCRSNYNNKANNNDIAEVRSINSILRRNRRILGAAISSESSVKIPKGRFWMGKSEPGAIWTQLFNLGSLASSTCFMAEQT